MIERRNTKRNESKLVFGGELKDGSIRPKTQTGLPKKLDRQLEAIYGKVQRLNGGNYFRRADTPGGVRKSETAAIQQMEQNVNALTDELAEKSENLLAQYESKHKKTYARKFREI